MPNGRLCMQRAPRSPAPRMLSTPGQGSAGHRLVPAGRCRAARIHSGSSRGGVPGALRDAARSSPGARAQRTAPAPPMNPSTEPVPAASRPVPPGVSVSSPGPRGHRRDLPAKYPTSPAAAQRPTPALHPHLDRPIRPPQRPQLITRSPSQRPGRLACDYRARVGAVRRVTGSTAALCTPGPSRVARCCCHERMPRRRRQGTLVAGPIHPPALARLGGGKERHVLPKRTT